MASDTDDVLKFEGGRGEGGRLIATGWHGYSCKVCFGFHLELFDDNGRTFAAMLVDGRDLVALANKLLACAKELTMGDVPSDKLN